ncbi:MAG: chromosome segregation protein SMC [Acidiferrobacterales bacterium]
MRLKTIKLAGFKSFVDPIAIPVSGSLIGVVGPNGCGKSNIIDAIRWVMGESSAKHLRGDSMADVIFNGSSARKPVGHASVELLFDNSDGSAPGQYARYAEISIRREASRDGRSDYFLNKTRCRRKDITSLFLGTGLGPRAYSIIEQDMVSRIVEAKPEELRAFFEEAAGISKYKERRRETEIRIRHTRENLARVEDIRAELATQLRRLKRQSNAAARYKELKQQERLTRAQWLALRWRALDKRVQDADRATAAQDIELERAVANQRSIEAKIEKIRNEQADGSEAFNNVQAEFYSVGAEIASIEQAIKHARDTRSERVRELEQVSQSWEESSRHLQTDLEKLKELSEGLEQSAPRASEALQRHDASTKQLREAEAGMREWQRQWDTFSELAAEPTKVREIQQARIEQVEQHITQLEERQDRLISEAREIVVSSQGVDLEGLHRNASELENEVARNEQALEELEQQIRHTQNRERETGEQLDSFREEQHKCDARLASLRELQAAAEGRDDAVLNEWLVQRGLDQAPRLASVVSVENGWERAAERVLGAMLSAVCVNRFDRVAGDLQDGDQLALAMVDPDEQVEVPVDGKWPKLLDKVETDVNLASLFADVYVTDTLAAALKMRQQLAPHESIVTRSGAWIGRNWLSLTSDHGARAGMLARERELEELIERSRTVSGELDGMLRNREQLLARLKELERERDDARANLSERIAKRTAAHEQRARQEANLAQRQARAAQIEHEQEELDAQLERDRAGLAAARRILQEAEGQSGTHDQRRQQLFAIRDQLENELERARDAAHEAQQSAHRLEVERQGMQTAFESTRESVTRWEGQLKQLASRRKELEKVVTDGGEPDASLKERLEEFLQKRLRVEEQLSAARSHVSELDAALREQEQARAQQEQNVQEIRERHEEARVRRQEFVTRRDGLAEQVAEADFNLGELVENLPEDATEEVWQSLIEELQAKIERLGPINLVAIEEYEEQAERKKYLDKQYSDLSEALETLEEAMRKIDRESRARFRETFDKVNAGFQSYFPRLFGGGQAYLELTENDLLTTGVAVMARPPGKRNSTIHLLSGGEKALSAVALLFALFELNPAPFCLLDEVDAPLDDANVERYCETLKTLSEKSQLVFVTHNKISMETAKVLIGVTMTEPGVSRLVAVDISEALEMAAQ